jgi:ABC-2 type transport system permease protein
MKTWLILLRPKWTSLKNRWHKPDPGFPYKLLALVLLAIGFWVLSFWVFERLLLYFRSVELFGDLLASQLMGMMLLTFFSILLFSNVVSSLSTFFLAEDLSLFLTRPVSLNRLYYARLAETMTHSSWMVLLFGLPVFLAYGWAYRVSFGFYLVLACSMIPFLIIPAALSTLLSTVLVNIFPARRTKDILFLLSIFFGIGLYFLLRFLQPERLVDPEAFAGLVEYVKALHTPSSPFLPSYWAAESLLPFYQDHQAPSTFLLGLLWSTAGAISVLGNWVFRGLYFEGWTKSQEARRARFTQRSMVEAIFRFFSRPFNFRIRALVLKDCKSFFRDTTQWSQLILLAALIIVYLYNFRVLPLDKSPLPTFFLQNLVSFLNMGLAGFVLAAVSARFVFPSVSLEGLSFWIIRSSPVSPRSFLWGKFWIRLIPLLILAEILILVSNRLLRVTPFMMILSSVTLFFMIFGIVALGVGIGALYPRFKLENAAQISSGIGGVLYMILSMIFIGIIVLLEAWPVYMLFMADFHHRALSFFQWTGVILCFSGVALLNGLAVVVPMRRGIQNISQMDF